MGKRLDFLLQEMNRETNTILSKSSTIGDLGIQMTTLGLGAKANIERMREQSLNLE
ncbi:MAG: endoribonuclease YicC domain-containing protein [Bryobacteraceae bacterium]